MENIDQPAAVGRPAVHNANSAADEALLPPDQRETVPASLYSLTTSRRTVPAGHASESHHCSAIAAAIAANEELSAAPFTAGTQANLVTTKDKLLAAVLALLARHPVDRIHRADFASQPLYESAVSSARTDRMHAMQLMLAINRLGGLSPKYLVLACEPPLSIESSTLGYSMRVMGLGIHGHKIAGDVVQMLRRTLLAYWRDHHLDVRAAATAALPRATAELLF